MNLYAKIDENKVIDFIRVSETKNILWLEQNFGGTWINVSANEKYNNAGVGMIFRPDLDAFIREQPFNSWTLNEETLEWQAPAPRPKGNFYWDEETTSWVEITTEETNG